MGIPEALPFRSVDRNPGSEALCRPHNGHDLPPQVFRQLMVLGEGPRLVVDPAQSPDDVSVAVAATDAPVHAEV